MTQRPRLLGTSSPVQEIDMGAQFQQHLVSDRESYAQGAINTKVRVFQLSQEILGRLPGGDRGMSKSIQAEKDEEAKGKA